MGQVPQDFVVPEALGRETSAPATRVPSVDATPAAPRARLRQAAGKDAPDRREPFEILLCKSVPGHRILMVLEVG